MSGAALSTTSPYIIAGPATPEVPIIVSIPHSGTEIPDDLIDRYRPEAVESLDDADFFVDQLYSFASELGMTMISSRYHRWVIDLNRHPDNTQLYDDGRIITSLTPTRDFHGEAIYRSSSDEPDDQEITRRKELYYHPYHQKLRTILDDCVKRFGQAILWEAHSIRRYLPLVHADPFPDLILGDNDRRSAATDLIGLVLSSFQQSDFSMSHNHPFKGGYITRCFGKPEDQVHAFQLEMSKDCYMVDTERMYDLNRAESMRALLSEVFQVMINWVS